MCMVRASNRYCWLGNFKPDNTRDLRRLYAEVQKTLQNDNEAIEVKTVIGKPETTLTAVKLEELEKIARTGQISRDDALWLVAQVKKRTAELVGIDQNVRKVTKRIDSILEKCREVKE